MALVVGENALDYHWPVVTTAAFLGPVVPERNDGQTLDEVRRGWDDGETLQNCPKLPRVLED